MMDSNRPRVAHLKAEQVAKVEAMEKVLGTYVVAYEHPVMPASLTQQQLAELERLESDLGVCLVAYQK